ncbi:hypothetical protein ACWCYZ_40940 [Streptomyces virginiae]
MSDSPAEVMFEFQLPDWSRDFRPPEKFPPRAPLETAYHYTDQAGLLGIISSRNIRAGDVEFMNDAQELIYARDSLLSILRVELENVTARQHEHKAAEKWRRRQYDRPRRELRSRERFRQKQKVHMQSNDEMDLPAVLSGIIDELERVGGPSESSPCHVYVSCFCGNKDLLSQWRGYGGGSGAMRSGFILMR